MSEVMKILEASNDPIEREMAQALRAFQAAKAVEGKKRSLGYEPRDYNRDGAVKLISKRVTSNAAGFESIDKELSYEAIVDRHPDRFDPNIVSLARVRLNIDIAKYTSDTYAMNFGENNRFWAEAKKDGLILMYEDPDVWEQINNGNETIVRKRFSETFRKLYGKDATKATITRWINYSRILRDGNSALYIHNADGILWWAETDGEFVELGQRKDERFTETNGNNFSRFVAKKSLNGWQSRNRNGELLKISNLHPIIESISHTQATMQRVSDLRAEYLQALIEGVPLKSWENLDEWNEVAAKGLKYKSNKAPVLGVDELVGEPSDYTGTRSNQIEGFVYVLGLKEYPGIFKVGHSNDVESRIKTLQIGVPGELIALHKVEFKDSALAEKNIHQLIQHKRVRGEWFHEPLDRIKLYIDMIKKRELAATTLHDNNGK